MGLLHSTFFGGSEHGGFDGPNARSSSSSGNGGRDFAVHGSDKQSETSHPRLNQALPSRPPATSTAVSLRSFELPLNPTSSSPSLSSSTSPGLPSRSPNPPKVDRPCDSSPKVSSLYSDYSPSSSFLLASKSPNTPTVELPRDSSSSRVSSPFPNRSPPSSFPIPSNASPSSTSPGPPSRSPSTPKVDRPCNSSPKVSSSCSGYSPSSSFLLPSKSPNTPTVERPRDSYSPIVSSPFSNCSPPSSFPKPSIASPSSTSPSKTSQFKSGREQIETPRFKQKLTDDDEIFEIPEDLQEQIKGNEVPAVVTTSLSPQNYADYFGTLLYAEDYEIEKWSDYLLSGVTLQLRAREEFNTQKYAGEIRNYKNNKNNEYPFVAFEIKAVPEKKPYLLSRDFVFLRPLGQKNTEPFKGVIFRVIKGQILVEFGNDFHRQHSSTKTYDVNFSFNRVCLKRSHVAVSAAKDPLLCKILFPNPGFGLRSVTFGGSTSDRVLRRIASLEGLIPYLIQGPLVEQKSGAQSTLSITGAIIREAILQICRKCTGSKILVCTPRNSTSDALIRSLLDVDDVQKTKLFRANAAFRDMDLVPDDIMQTSMFKGECFTCPPLHELKAFDVVTSTFMSSFRLHGAGIEPGHFSHIFLLDASSAMEPEATVALANLVSEETVIVITGSSRDAPRWVRSQIGRRNNGLKRSLFHRLMEREPYSKDDPMYVVHVS